jgi:hypothetical protein
MSNHGLFVGVSALALALAAKTARHIGQRSHHLHLSRVKFWARATACELSMTWFFVGAVAQPLKTTKTTTTTKLKTH